MAEDYYATLGVPKTASLDDIKKAYRKLAVKYHPDRNPGNKDAEEMFKKVSVAYDILSNPEKKKQYDQFGSEYFTGGGGRPGGAGGFQGGFRDPNDIFAQFFGAGGPGANASFSFEDLFGGNFSGGRRGGRRRPMKGNDVQTELAIPLDKAFNGGEVVFNINGRQLKVRVPAGVKDGSKLRVAGEGEPSPYGGENGDLFVILHMQEHPIFRRDGQDLTCTVPIPFVTAVNGGIIDVPTMTGKVRVKIAAGVQNDKVLRVKGRGFPALKGGTTGDLLVKIRIEMPSQLTKQQKDLLDYFTASLTQDNNPLRTKFESDAANYMG